MCPCVHVQLVVQDELLLSHLNNMTSSESDISLGEKIYRSLKKKKKIITRSLSCDVPELFVKVPGEIRSSNEWNEENILEEDSVSYSEKNEERDAFDYQSGYVKTHKQMVTNSLMEGILWQKMNTASSRLCI